MSIRKLFNELKLCASEEAVKASFIKHAEFPAAISQRVDLYVGSVLFEFKFNVNGLITNYHQTLAQAIVYYKRILDGSINLPIPTHIALVDINEAVIVTINNNITDLVKMPFKWDNPASSPDKNLVSAVKDITLELVSYKFETENSLQGFVDTIKSICVTGTQNRRIISKLNFEDIYKEWTSVLGDCFSKDMVNKLGSFFIADLLEDSMWDAKRGLLYFPTLDNVKVEIPSRSYDEFWKTYARPPAYDVQEIILAKAHMLVPEQARRVSGAFYTPPAVAAKAYEYLDKSLGKDWQDEYYVWDPCCGTGNLETPHKRPDRLFMSTIDMNEVLLLKNGNYFPGAEIFHFDFLNDSYFALPDKLRAIIESEPQNLVVLMNPPYAEATKSPSSKNYLHKTDVSFTKIGELMLNDDMGAAKNELFMQFMYRVLTEIPLATIAVFSTLKYIVAPNAAQFRDKMLKNKIPMMGFLVPGKVFPGVKGEFPIGFMVWGNGRYKDTPAVFNIYNSDLSEIIGSKVYREGSLYLNSWFKRPASGKKGVPLIGALEVREDDARVSGLTDKAIGYATMPGGDLQQSSVVFILSNAYHNGNGSAITPDTFEFCMVSAAVRKLITPTWLNDRDQFTVPYCDRPAVKLPDGITEIATTGEYATDADDRRLPATKTNLPADFISDCVVWVLFHGCNNSSSFTATYKGQQYIIPNEFYPFTRSQATAMIRSDLSLSRAVERAADDTFVSRWLNNHGITEEAASVLQAGKRVYERYYAELPNLHKVKYKLEFWNPGWYQIRMSLKEYLGKSFPELEELNKAMKVLRLKLLPQVYDLGFLPYEMCDSAQTADSSCASNDRVLILDDVAIAED